MIVGFICSWHGYFKDNHCPVCKEEGNRLNAKFTTTNWVKGWYEHIDTNPIYIEDKSHLIRECKKRGVIPKAFSGPKSRGTGIEIKRR